MRIEFVALIVLIFLSSCIDESGPGLPPYVPPRVYPNDSVSDSASWHAFLFTLSTSRGTTYTDDILTAAVTATNESSQTQVLDICSCFYQWKFRDSTGRTIMWGPEVANWVIIEQPMAAHELITLTDYGVYRQIYDTSGRAVVPGKYTLEMDIGPNSEWATMTIPIVLR